MAEESPVSNRLWRWVVVIFTIAGIVLAVNQVFLLSLGGITIIDNGYLYLLAALFLPTVFVLRPARKDATGPAWHDIVLFLLALGVNLLLASRSLQIISQGWSFQSPLWAAIASIVLWALAVEAARRTAGTVFALFVLVISLYPMFAIYVPGIFQGQSFPPLTVATYHALGTTSMMGTVMRIFGSTLFGFMLFSCVMEGTGAGKFFIDLAYSIMGTKRGGPAKVAVVSSALMGMISGSAVANVATVGTVTIPAMKKAGFRAETAASVESCASVGGVIMPPVMGAVAFIMAGIMGISYSTVVVVAIVPSVLWYTSLFIHVDGEAAKAGVKGIPRDQLPSLRRTIMRGWPHIIVFAALVILMFSSVVSETQAPFLAAVLALLFAMTRRETRITPGRGFNIAFSTGKVLSNLVGVLLPVGLILGSLTVTGMAQAVTGDLIRLAGNNLYLILLLTFVASFVLGLGLTASIVYIMLMVVVGPHLISIGLNELGVNFFLLYSGVLGDLTPPTAIAVFAAASIAGAPPMKASMVAMRMSAVLYIIPFIFVLDPALVLQGSVAHILVAVPFAIVGVALTAGGIVGYVWGGGMLSLPARVLSIGFGVVSMLPFALPIRIAALILALATLLVNRRFPMKIVERAKVVEDAG
ncbi:MAG: TRAP transporter fused permease subunit [Dehalococcoidia bacterium]|nr:TRAP transporter fused permease subunit [Dehalococcoidia bacterium]